MGWQSPAQATENPHITVAIDGILFLSQILLIMTLWCCSLFGKLVVCSPCPVFPSGCHSKKSLLCRKWKAQQWDVREAGVSTGNTDMQKAVEFSFSSDTFDPLKCTSLIVSLLSFSYGHFLDYNLSFVGSITGYSFFHEDQLGSAWPVFPQQHLPSLQICLRKEKGPRCYLSSISSFQWEGWFSCQ